MRKEIFNQKGAFLYYAVVITSLLLAIALGLGTILISQIRGLKEMGHSVMALFGADTGMEKILYLDGICQSRVYPDDCASSTVNPDFWELCEGQMSLADSTSCIGLYYYSTSTNLTSDLKFEASATTTVVETATTTIFRSKGIYKESQRQIECSRPAL